MTKRLTQTILAAVAALSLSQAANAADIYRGPAYKAPAYVAPAGWSGPYIGIVGGYGFGDADFTGGPVASTTPSGGFIGATLGYNFQAGSLVFGVEGDGVYSLIEGDTACGAGTCNVQNDWLATVRARLGYAGWGAFMPYITGGAAFGRVEATTPGGSVGSTQTGWTAGVGIEYAFGGAWSAKLEYLYVDLGTLDLGAAGGDLDFTANLVRVGLNYRF